jgi:molybdate transport system permease protein
VSDTLTGLGIRSHQIAFQPPADAENVFPCWLVGSSEAPHEMTLYLRLHAAPRPGEPAHIQADVPKDLWRSLSLVPQPWPISLHPERLLLLEC